MQDAICHHGLKSTRTPSPIACRIAIIKRSSELRPVERLVLRSLVDFIGNNPEAVCWPSVGTLAAECGISTRQCRRLLRAFEAAGWIECSPRERADGGQTSNTIRWIRPAPAPAMPAKSIADPQSASSPAPAPPPAAPQSASSLAPAPPPAAPQSASSLAMPATSTPPRHPCPPPPDTSVRPIEKTSEDSDRKHDVAAGCFLSDPQSASSPAPAPPPAAPQSASSLAMPATAMPAKSIADPQSASSPTKPAPAKSARWIEIAEHKFTDPHEAKRVFLAVVAGGLLTSSEADRLLFFAAWCAVSRKHREKRVKHPAAVMQWLLRHQRVLRAYPSTQDEDKAREAVRRLWPPAASLYAATVASTFGLETARLDR